jgi:phosphoadenosine phosphosulfate reductase
MAKTESLIREFAKKNDKPYYVCVSWGKDSLVLLNCFVRMNIECPVIYIRQLDNENPESLKVRDNYLARFQVVGYKEITYSYRNANPSWYKKGKPDRWYQILLELQDQYGCHVTGIRADESAKRKKRCCVFGAETINTFAPMMYMTCADVFAYLSLFHLPVHPNYAMLGEGRWPRERIRVAAIGNAEGTGMGRREWEREYYGDVLRRLESTS